MLGYQPAELPVSALVRIGSLFDVGEKTMRVALVRMVADGDAVAEDGVYRLTDRLVQRQREQEDNCSPTPTDWNGDWQFLVVTSSSRSQSDRVELRRSMIHARYESLREGVWTRPDNLVQSLDETVTRRCRVFKARYDDDVALAGDLWDLRGWAAEARRLIRSIDSVESLKSGFVVNAEVFRHLQIDPCLPPALLPAEWPGNELRTRFAAFTSEYALRLQDFSAR